MSWRDFWQMLLAFIVLVLSIVLFQILKLDTNFLVTFVLVIFSISISIYFFVQSNSIVAEIKERISAIEKQFNNDIVNNYNEDDEELSEKEIKDIREGKDE